MEWLPNDRGLAREAPEVEADEIESGLTRFLVMLIAVAPIALMVGAIRWNIADQLDADLSFVLTFVCDTILLFCIVFPLSFLSRNRWAISGRRFVLREVMQLVRVAGIFAMIAFAALAVSGFAPLLFWEIWKLITG